MKNYIGDYIIDKIGGHGRYQIFLGICLFIIGFCSDFYYFYIPLMETPPIGEYYLPNGEKKVETITYEVCEKYNYTVIQEKSKDTIFYEYDIFCSKWRASAFGTSLCFGSLIGTILIGYLQKFGTKTCVIISATLMIITTPIIYIKSFVLQIIGNMIFGFANVNLFMLRNIIMTEITDSKYRSYFINANISTNILCNIFYFFIFGENFDYKYVYTFNALLLLMILIVFIICTVESPRYFLMKVQKNSDDVESREKLIKHINYISKFNKKENEDVEEILSKVNGSFIKELENEEENYVINKENSEILLITHNDRNAYSSHKVKLFFFTLLFFTFVFMMMSFTFELKLYSNYLNFYFYIINLSMFVSFYLISLLMNISFIGRKFSILLCLSLMIILKIVKFGLETDEEIEIKVYVLLFLIIRLLLFTCQIPVHVLITESFNTKERLTNYSFMYIFAKTAAIIAPFTIEYLSKTILDFSIIGICFMIISIVLFYMKETLNNSLKDS